MRPFSLTSAFLLVLPVICSYGNCKSLSESASAKGVILRTLSAASVSPGKVDVEMMERREGKDTFSVSSENGVLKVRGSSATAACYGFYSFLRKYCHGSATWSGIYCDRLSYWPSGSVSASSPFEFRYFLNVCTFGYSMPYWDWTRWEKEIDLMALHGVNMPLASIATEAIDRRMWRASGLTDGEIDSFFTGPAYLPWHRMGNLNGYDGPLDNFFLQEQVALQHKVLDRMKSLGMKPVVNAFAGFVPQAFVEKHSDLKYARMEWGGFYPEFNACVLTPDSPYFEELGSSFIKEWEKEFGKGDYYLSDSFNEMELPVDESDTASKHSILRQYGKAIYNSIAAGDPDAVWVTQGWTFGYQHGFWDAESLKALLSDVPDDKLIIVDLANDYPKWIWHTEQTWKVRNGYYGKRWIFSYVPNFGGKTLPTGDIPMYCSASAEALEDGSRGKLAGFGSAPEGIENNEIIYELLADMGWRSKPLAPEEWLRNFALSRYGTYNQKFKEFYKLLLSSVYGSLYSYPRFTWQTVIPDVRRKNDNALNDDFDRAVSIFLECRDSVKNKDLYIKDAIMYGCMSLGRHADDLYVKALNYKDAGDDASASECLDSAVRILTAVDRLLVSASPGGNMEGWVRQARLRGRTPEEKDRYESDAKKLITIWGGRQNDYAARFWSGLIKDYYIPRMEINFSVDSLVRHEFEEKWVNERWKNTTLPYDNPLDTLRLNIEGLGLQTKKSRHE